MSTFTNLANPANFPGDYFWMAPGGGEGTFVESSFNSSIAVNGFTQATGPIEGTSQAAPHVAGLYALIKAAIPGISVDGASEWIRLNASQPIAPVCISSSLPCTSSQNVTFSRIRLPNF